MAEQFLSFIGGALARGFSRRIITVPAGGTRPHEPSEWIDALVVVERGEIEVEGSCGIRMRFAAGAVFWLADTPVEAIHNPGDTEAVITAVSRSRRRPSDVTVAVMEIDGFPTGFFARADPGDDRDFYDPDRLVTHIDDGAIDAVGALYDELGVDGEVLDLMSSWVSHFRTAPHRLVVLGMNATELAANRQASSSVVHDLNAEPTLPFGDGEFDDATCCVSVDYLIRPVEVFREVARILRPGGRFIVTFSNRCFPTKAIRGWLATPDRARSRIVEEYFIRSERFSRSQTQLRTPIGDGGDPLWAVWASRVR